MKLFWLILTGALFGATVRTHAADAAAFSGHWTMDVSRSSAIAPWTQCSLTIAASDGAVEIDRSLNWDDNRSAKQAIRASTDGRTVTANPVTYWVETWFNNAYIGGDKSERVTAEWLDVGRVLKVEAKLTLNLQQGDHPVHIYDEYHLSADGQTLRLYEIRSTRNQPLTYLFTRSAVTP